MIPPLPPLLLAQRQLRCDASILAVEEAWTIALTWCEPLRDKVLLERDPDESSGVAKSYRWIRFHIDISDRDQVCAARAAAVTWFALSCCPRYSSEEHPVFWKCVFSEYAHVSIGHRIQRSQSITDAYGFFDGEDIDFPRFKLDACGNEANLLLFCGQASLRDEDKGMLTRVTDSLSRWIDRKRTTRRPVVFLDVVRVYGFQARREEASGTPIASGWLPITAEANRLTGDVWSSPLFSLQEVNFHGSHYINWSKTMEHFYELLRCHDVDISAFRCCDLTNPRLFEAHRSPGSLASLVRCLLRLPGSGVRARTTTLDLQTSDSRWIAAFASALPHSTSIQSVWIVPSDGRYDFVEKTPFVWLAYALFHPDSPSSPWKRIVFYKSVLREQSLAMLKAMARGNNLVAMLEGRKPRSDGYYRARLAAKANIYDVLATSIAQRFKRTAIVTSDGTLEVEVCDVASDDPKQWSKWVAVVVPAYGLGWCRSADVTCVVKRPPCESPITELVVNTRSQLDPVILSLLGRRLVHLDLIKHPEHRSNNHLKRALSLFPSLQSLAIRHNGQLWASEDMESVLPNLRELQLQLKIHKETLAAMNLPRSLHVLRVDAQDGQGTYHRSADAIRHILTQRSSLRVFHWEDAFGSYPHTPYTMTRSETAVKLQELALPVSQTSESTTRLPATCTAAFLSVLYQKEPKYSAMTSMDQRVVEMIVSFAGTRRTRLILLAPETGERR